MVLPCWDEIGLLIFERNWATRINTKCVGRYQCDGSMDGYRCFPSSMTLQIVSMFEYGYDVYITADDVGALRGAASEHVGGPSPCQCMPSFSAKIPLPPTRRRLDRMHHAASPSDVGDGWPRRVAYRYLSRMRRQTTDVWAFCNFHLSSIQYLAHNRQRAQLW